MMNSETLFSSPLARTPSWLIVVFLVVSFIGFLDATYLAVQHYLGVAPSCFITTGCEAVLTSEYSEFGGIPVALFGSIYYLFLFLLAILYFNIKQEKVIRFAAFFTPIGFLASLYFIYLQLFVIKEICPYCVISAIASTTLFVFGLSIIIKSIRSRRFLEREQ